MCNRFMRDVLFRQNAITPQNALAALLGAVVLASSPVWSQSYPAKPVRVIVPFAPGGGTDGIARLFTQKLSELWGQQAIVENRAGAGGNIGTAVVAKSPADGYTMLFTPSGLAISSAIYKKLPFDPMTDFTAISLTVQSHLALVVAVKSPVTSVQELIDRAKANPGKLNYGSSGIGAPSHLMAEFLKLSAGLDMVHIPYKGDAQSMPALMADEVQMVFVPIFIALQHMKAGRLRGIGVVGLARSKSAPELPTMVEAGMKDFNFSSWLGYFGPAGMPRDVVLKISRDIVAVHGMPDVIARLPGMGLEPGTLNSDEFATYYRSEIEKYARVVKGAGIPAMD